MLSGSSASDPNGGSSSGTTTDDYGSVSYTIMANPVDPDGDRHHRPGRGHVRRPAAADTPQIYNTVDAGVAPDQLRGELAGLREYATVHRPWSGSDAANGSAVNNFTIYVSDNSGPYTAWLQDTSLTSAPFVGQDGHTYSFYSVAEDNAGNVQSTPAAAQATTEVDPTPPSTTGISFPAAGGSYNASGWAGTLSGSASDSFSGVQQEQVSILDDATSQYWNGTAFSSSTEVFFPATLANPGGARLPGACPSPAATSRPTARTRSTPKRATSPATWKLRGCRQHSSTTPPRLSRRIVFRARQGAVGIAAP